MCFLALYNVLTPELAMLPALSPVARCITVNAPGVRCQRCRCSWESQPWQGARAAGLLQSHTELPCQQHTALTLPRHCCLQARSASRSQIAEKHQAVSAAFTAAELN